MITITVEERTFNNSFNRAQERCEELIFQNMSNEQSEKMLIALDKIFNKLKSELKNARS